MIGWGLALLHVGLAVWLFRAGLCETLVWSKNQWSFFWQFIPIEDMRTRPWQSLWVQHTQPPLYGLWGLLLLRLGGPNYLPLLVYLGNLACGAAATALSFALVRALTGSRAWGAAGGLAMALNPALFHYEIYLLYSAPVLFLVTASAWCLWRALTAPASAALTASVDSAHPSHRWLWGFVLALNALVLTRSLYHWAFLIAALAFAWPAWRRLRGRWLALALLLAIAPPGLWYTKNAVQYGFFGASSWFGLGLYKCAQVDYTWAELERLRDDGVLPRFVVDHYPFQHQPSEYVPFGFDRRSAIPLLARNDFRNINVPAISRAYGDAAKHLIRHDPWRYLRSVHNSYVKFARPPSRYAMLHPAVDASIVPWEGFVSQWAYGQAVTGEIELLTRVQFGSLFYFYFPLLLAGGLVLGTALWRRTAREGAPPSGAGRALDRSRSLLVLYLVYVCLYVAVVGSLFENGENERFRFPIEPFTLALALVLIRLAWQSGRRVAAARAHQ